jgi:lysyl endopeptidase
LRINNPSWQEIASSDDAGTQCGWLLSNISLVAAVTGTYVIRAGCFSSGACSGVVTYSY